MRRTADNENQLHLFGYDVVTTGPGTWTVKAKKPEPDEWWTVKIVAAKCEVCDEIVDGWLDAGLFTWRWKNHEGAGGTRLIYAPSVRAFLQAKTQIGKMHPALL